MQQQPKQRSHTSEKWAPQYNRPDCTPAKLLKILLQYAHAVVYSERNVKGLCVNRSQREPQKDILADHLEYVTDIPADHTIPLEHRDLEFMRAKVMQQKQPDRVQNLVLPGDFSIKGPDGHYMVEDFPESSNGIWVTERFGQKRRQQLWKQLVGPIDIAHNYSRHRANIYEMKGDSFFMPVLLFDGSSCHDAVLELAHTEKQRVADEIVIVATGESNAAHGQELVLHGKATRLPPVFSQKPFTDTQVVQANDPLALPATIGQHEFNLENCTKTREGSNHFEEQAGQDVHPLALPAEIGDGEFNFENATVECHTKKMKIPKACASDVNPEDDEASRKRMKLDNTCKIESELNFLPPVPHC